MTFSIYKKLITVIGIGLFPAVEHGEKLKKNQCPFLSYFWYAVCAAICTVKERSICPMDKADFWKQDSWIFKLQEKKLHDKRERL